MEKKVALKKEVKEKAEALLAIASSKFGQLEVYETEGDSTLSLSLFYSEPKTKKIIAMGCAGAFYHEQTKWSKLFQDAFVDILHNTRFFA